jgi:hypothetical protein
VLAQATAVSLHQSVAATLMQHFEGLSAGGLVVVVAPVICGVFWFAVIAMGAMLRKWLHRSR